MKKSNYTVIGEPYEVDPAIPDWHEYTITLLDSGEIVDEWDSLTETYNGVPGQRLTRQNCLDAIAQIRDDVNRGHADWWFTLLPSPERAETQ